MFSLSPFLFSVFFLYILGRLGDICCVISRIVEVFVMQSSMDALDKKNSALETELLKVRKDSTDTIQKLQEFEQKCYQLQQNVKRCFSDIHNPLSSVYFSLVKYV